MFKFATNKFSAGHQPAHSDASSSLTASNGVPGPSTTSAANNAASRRRLLQKELFAFNKIADKGFPSKPSAMDYDRKLRLLALGTKNGDIRIYGSPGTQQQQLSCYQDVHPFPIQRILFVQGQHQLITLSERVHRNDLTNKGESLLYLVLWQIPGEQAAKQTNLVEKVKEYQLDPKAINGSKLSAMTLLNDNSHLFLGFESGDVYVFNVGAFQLVPGVINKDYILKNLPDQPGKRLTQLGAVESICHHPRQLTKLLLAYQRGLWIIFDFIKNQIEQINQTQQQLESAVFYQAGECVATAHSDGSFILWDLENGQQSTQTSSGGIATCSSNSAPNIVYGPYPCKPVQKCLVKTCRNDQPFVIFSGGCPRVNYGDKITISVIQGENLHVCFDFTSKIIDYFTIDRPSIEKQAPGGGSLEQPSYDNPQALFVLLEEEFVAIDLASEGWPQFKLPYLYSVHSSAIICTHYVNNVSKRFYESLKHYGGLSQDPNDLYSEKEWPMGGGQGLPSTTASPGAKVGKDLLLTGHEDGSVRFWDVTNMSMTLIYRLRTGEYFQTEASVGGDEDPNDFSASEPGTGDLDNWPPFRKVGTFDPYSDDPKLGVQKIYLCPQREILVVAGTAGQVLIMQVNEQSREVSASAIAIQKINLIGVSPEVESHFVWKGHEPLLTRQAGATLKLAPGYQLHSLIQLYPPATVSALALSTDWQLVAMGTSHGFAMFDYFHMRPLLIRCTLDPAMLLQSANPNDSGGNMISRRKSLKKSLRESFRKLRRGRSQKQPNANKAKENTNANLISKLNALPNSSQMRVEHIDDDDGQQHHKPIERQVESREFKPMDDIPPSVIRYMYFVRTFITSSQQQTNSLWVGTNTGIIYIYALQLGATGSQQTPAVKSVTSSPGSVRAGQAVNCLLAKEMRLKHRAPVVHIQVIDQNMQPLPLTDATASTQTGEPNHKVIICSEEQFKVFQLPTLKPVCKFKLTAVEGARVRRIGYNAYTSRQDVKYSEFCLSCLSNLGDLSVYSLPQLKRQVQIQCMKQQDINAITSFVFSKQGQAFYLQSPSEFVHISMSARDTPQQLAPVAASTAPRPPANRNTSPKKQKPASVLSPKQQPTSPVAAPAAPKPQCIPSSVSSNSIVISSPRSPPPPVPAPRTLINNNKDESVRQQNGVVKKQDSFHQQKPMEGAISTSSLSKPTGNMQHSTPAAKNSICIDASPIKLDNKQLNETEDECAPTPVTASSTNPGLTSPGSRHPTQNIEVSGETTGNSASSSTFNQSTISTSTVAQQAVNTSSSTHTNNLNNNNLSMITTAHSDSFNASSSGYNGSMSCVGVSGVVDLSMDSVVDKFSDEFHDLSVKKIQPTIDEDSGDSLLYENSGLSEPTANITSSTTATTTAATAKQQPVKTNGQINHTFSNDSGNCSGKKPTNGCLTSSHLLNDDEHVVLTPQKSSSPLGKLVSNQLNPRINKIEQVTKRIENGSKQEYRETVID